MTGTYQLSKEDAAQIATQGFNNPVFFCKYFLAKWFPLDMPWLHRGMLAILTRKCGFLEDDPELDLIIKNFIWYDADDVDQARPHYIFHREEDGTLKMVLGKYTLLLIPRGFSKTTLANAVNLYNIVYQESRFPLYVSKTAKHASKQLSSITKQITSNPRIISVFGTVKPEQRNNEGLKWSESEGFIQTTTDIRMAAIGSGGQARGMLDDAQRPDRLYIDDLEDRESTKTDDRRKDTLDWLLSDLLPVLPELDPNATATMMSNLVHPDCAAVNIMRDPNWTVVHMGALDVDGKPLWPALMDEKKLARKKQSYALQGKLHLYYLEYFNEVRAPEDAKFKKSFFRYEAVGQDKLVTRSIAIDPAISDEEGADFCTITVSGMRLDGMIQILDQWGKVGASPREQVTTYFEMIIKWMLHQHIGSKFGVEANAYQAALIHLLREEMFRSKKNYGVPVYFEVTPLHHRNKKSERIEGILQPRYANGFIVHQRQFPELETSLLDWPNAKKKDWADSAAMSVGLLDDAAPFASQENFEEDTMPPLEEVMGGDWRAY